jgi:hypothetical protein
LCDKYNLKIIRKRHEKTFFAETANAKKLRTSVKWFCSGNGLESSSTQGQKKQRLREMSENEKSQNSATEGKGGNNKTLIIIGLIIIILLLIIIIVLLLRKNPGTADAGSGEQQGGREVASSTRIVLDEETASTIYEEMRQEVEEGMFECNMSMKWTYPDGNSESPDAIVVNSENNKHPFYFDVYLKDTNELLFSSPVLPVGTQLTGIKLDRALPAGTYKAVCQYTLLKDEESQEVISSAGFVVTITIQN